MALGSRSVQEHVRQVAFDKIDTRGYSVARGIAARDFQRGRRNIRGDDARGRQFVRQRNGDAAGAGAHISNAKFLVAPLRMRVRSDPQALERHFDHMLGFRPRDQHIGRDLEIQPPKFLVAGEVLHRDTARTLGEQRKVFLVRSVLELVFGMRVNPSTVPLERVHQEQFRSQRGRGHVLPLKLIDPVAKRGED